MKKNVWEYMNNNSPNPSGEKGKMMTNKEKSELRKLVKENISFEAIRKLVNCSDATIRAYIKTFTSTERKI